MECVSLLIEWGASPLIEASGHLPSDLTRNSSMEDYLKKEGIKVSINNHPSPQNESIIRFG